MVRARPAASVAVRHDHKIHDATIAMSVAAIVAIASRPITGTTRAA
jgi:hypothetical protein